jgi:CHASE3 domain sensor protein
MFNPFRPEDPALDEAIAEALSDLRSHTSEEDEYKRSVDQLVKLYALKPKALDPNTLLTVAGNIIIGVAVLKYEQTGIITSKIWNFMSKI